MSSSYNVAKLVIISHTLVTILVITLMTQHFFTTINNKELLYYTLVYSTSTIILHMAYRVLEKKLQQTFNSYSSLLVFHILMSVGAIIFGFITGKNNLTLIHYITATTLWILSISSGWLIFNKKYINKV